MLSIFKSKINDKDYSYLNNKNIFNINNLINKIKEKEKI